MKLLPKIGNTEREVDLGYMYLFELFFFFFNIYPGVELLDHIVVLFLVF